MITVGELLKNRRVELGLTLLEAEKSIKIRQKFLAALENNEFSSLPFAYIRGFIQNYTRYLGLNEKEMLAFYRRQTNTEKAKVLPTASEIVRPKFVFTPTVFTIVGVCAAMVFFVGYLLQQYFLFTGAPNLVVSTPQDYAVVDKTSVEVAGQADVGVSISINNENIPVHDDGSFKVNVDLSAGLNILEIVAKNKFNRETKISRHVRQQTPIN